MYDCTFWTGSQATWAASMAIAVGLFGPAVLNGSGWRSFMILAVFFVESALLGAVAGGSFGQLLCRIAVIRLDRVPLGLLRSVVRAALVCVVIPPLIVGVHRRGLHDLVAEQSIPSFVTGVALVADGGARMPAAARGI